MKLSINIELDTDMKWFTDRKWYTKTIIVLVVLLVIIGAYEKCSEKSTYQYQTAITEEVAPVAEEAAAPVDEESLW